MQIANFRSGPSRDVAVGHLEGIWRDLGRLIDTHTVGLRRIEIAAGHFSTPAHEHGGDEEIFFVLDGEGLLWQEGETHAIERGDCIVHRPRSGAHTLRAGEGGLDVLVFGQRVDATLTALPRAGIAWSFPRWVELPGADHPFAREAAAGAPECPQPSAQRPEHIVALSDLPTAFEGRSRSPGAAAGARSTGLNHVALAAGESGAPPHCHSREEEIFVVLEGAGAVELYPRGSREPERRQLHSSDVFSRPAGSGVAHALRAGEDGLTYLAYGTRDPSDMCFYPLSGKVSLRGLGIALSSPQIEYLP
ncbi:MAG TPA: cupin domain-containing protein [Solirubrobacteraceae bacterium]